MCGRSSLTKTEKELEERFGATFYSEDLERYNPLPNFNVAPSHVLPAILNTDPKHFSPLRWGFIPFWAKDKNIGYKMINARLETILEKSSFKKAFADQRCLIPSDGFYEWKKEGKAKQAFRITKKDESLFAFAGIWSKWKSPEGETVHSFSIITQQPNSLVEKIHDRMPVILREDQEDIWLSDSVSPTDLKNMLEPYPEDLMQAYPVSSDVNKVSNNNKSLIESIQDSPPTLFD